MSPEVVDLLDGAVLVTGNRNKIQEARRLCGSRLDSVELDLPEIQSLDVHEILRAKAAAAFGEIEKPLLVEETALELAALNGFPGPLVKWLLAAVGAEGIARMAAALAETAATARCTLLFFDGEREFLGEGTAPGELVLPARGEMGFGWDPVFQPRGQRLTFAEMAPEEKDRVSHRAAAWCDLVEVLQASG